MPRAVKEKVSVICHITNGMAGNKVGWADKKRQTGTEVTKNAAS